MGNQAVSFVNHGFIFPCASDKSGVGTGREQHFEGFNPELLQGFVFVNRKVLQAPGQLRVDVYQRAKC